MNMLGCERVMHFSAVIFGFFESVEFATETLQWAQKHSSILTFICTLTKDKAEKAHETSNKTNDFNIALVIFQAFFIGMKLPE